jgi:hypothetical protein
MIAPKSTRLPLAVALLAPPLLLCAPACSRPKQEQAAATTVSAMASGSAPAAGSASAPDGGTYDVGPATRAAWRDLVGREPPPVVTSPDERRFYATCLELTRALDQQAKRLEQEASAGSRPSDDPTAMVRALDAVRASPPPGVPASDVGWCAEYTLAGLQAELGAVVAEEALTLLQALGGAMAAAHAQTAQLCPSSSEPVPPKLDQVLTRPYQPKAEDWQAPAWRCLRFRWLKPMRFQVELRTEASSFVLLARGSLAGDRRVDEYRLHGSLEGSTVTLGEVTGRFLSEQAEKPSPSSSSSSSSSSAAAAEGTGPLPRRAASAASSP